MAPLVLHCKSGERSDRTKTLKIWHNYLTNKREIESKMAKVCFPDPHCARTLLTHELAQEPHTRQVHQRKCCNAP